MTTLTTQTEHDLIAMHALSVDIEDISVERFGISNDAWTRYTTVISLSGGGHTGRGEDVTWIADHHDGIGDRLQAALPGLRACTTIGEVDTLAPTLPLSHPEASNLGMGDYPTWALVSAALDLALRQSGLNLAGLLGRQPQPLNWVLSMGLGDPPDTDKVLNWAREIPGLGFKLDATALWTDDVCATLADAVTVGVLDLKGLYPTDSVGSAADPELYARLASYFPNAIFEDPGHSDEAASALDPVLHRISYDQPLHGPADVDAQDLPLAFVNIKPSRFGSLTDLLSTIALAAERDLPCYSGGQYELGIGRTQVQEISAMYFPDAPNDIAPAVFHTAVPGDDVPHPRLAIPTEIGFGWDATPPAGRAAG